MRVSNNGGVHHHHGVIGYDIVTIPSASPARRGLTFQTVSSAEIRRRNVERWQRAALHRKARETERSGAGLALVARDAIAMSQASSLVHRAMSPRQVIQRELETLWKGVA